MAEIAPAPAPAAPIPVPRSADEVATKAHADRAAARAGRRAVAQANLQKTRLEPVAAEPVEVAKPVEAKPTEVAKPADPEPKPDPATDRAVRSIEQAKKKWLDEQRAEKAETETNFRIREAKLAQREKEIEGKVTSMAELKKLRASEILDRLELSEDDHDEVARMSYARTKAGKVDPRAQAAAQEAARSSATRAQAGTVTELRAEIEELKKELRGEFTRRDQAAMAGRWIDDGLKAVPSDKPTYFAKQLAIDPDATRKEFHAIGAELEKANDGETPTHAEVIEEFEKRKRAQLKSLGLDPDALLAPPKPAEKPAKTLEVGATTMTRSSTKPSTREELRATALANLRARQRTTADQT